MAIWDTGQRLSTLDWGTQTWRSHTATRWWGAKNIFQHAVAWVVLSLFFYVLLLSSCWVCSVCNDCGPYPNLEECPNLQTDEESRFSTVCLSGGFQQPGDGAFRSEEYYLQEGKYVCGCCGNPLFPHFAKYDSGADFPTFWSAWNSTSLDIDSHSPCVHCGTYREVLCQNCGAKLGSVTSDGPPPSGQRYTINGICISHSFSRTQLDYALNTPQDQACQAYDQVDKLWHDGNCASDRPIVQHSTSMPSGWMEVSIASVVGSTVVFILFIAFRVLKIRYMTQRPSQAARSPRGSENDVQIWGVQPSLNLLEIGRGFNPNHRDEALPQMNNVVIKVFQPDGEAAIGIPDTFEVPFDEVASVSDLDIESSSQEGPNHSFRTC
mmetsp:Transcript_25470/g.35089  ORF Transcript_25470/g.35089 Transcript_25470/m.35089 type:complete len:379 (+) Transcript_25470:135-1271(+)|eukprot:CAMPEP_0196589708 /NCGR_PEP_ID=MMETSP1081-20130531/64369_1 /TAXON_ID=36882 /ORGANISM="Pyramimonas amylifera, Strain CCMP720" /LENGTH=378 /DNA_ID=CAMNT_0041912583 /DNA_START=115 /DNA_END=1254 /DNA_ORIENTATION=-